MNPNFLLKDELLYELGIRGISSNADVQTLRRLFRSGVSEGLPVDLSKVSSLSIEELYASTVSKIVELQNQVTQSKSALFHTPRFRTRISHLRGRLVHLLNLDVLPVNITTSHYQELHDQLDRIEQSITNLEMADQQGQGVKGEQEEVVNIAQQPSRTHPDPLPGRAYDTPAVEDGGVTGDVSTVTVAANQDTESRLVQLAQASAETGAAAPSAPGQGATQVFTPHLYQRLPHPLGHLLKELPIVDGTDVNLLCDFLLKVLKMRQVGQLPDQTIYEVMYPYCRGELLAFMSSTITARESFENFHARLLGQFLPCRQISQLRIERYERAQFEGEPLATYVQSIRDAALMLRIREDETRMVERIVEGFTPAQRARFVFQAPPSSLVQLERLAVVDRNIAYADRTRTVQTTADTVGMVEVHPRIEAPKTGRSQSRRVSRPGKPVVCFYCRKPGHVQNRCFLRLSQTRKSGRPATTGQP